MANGLEQLKNVPQKPNVPESKRPAPAERVARAEQERAAAAERGMKAKEAADRQAERIQAKLRALDSTMESPAPAPAKEEKKGLFARAGGWLKGLFTPSIEDRSEAHAKAEAAKNPLVAQQMREAGSDGAISKAEFKKLMAEGAVAAKAEAKRKAEQALKDRTAAIGELGIVAHDEAFGNLGKERAAANAQEQKAAEARAANAARAELMAGSKGKEARIALGLASAPEAARSSLSKQAEKLTKGGDAEFMGYVDDENTPEEAANLVAQHKEAQSVARKEQAKSAVRGAVETAKNLGSKAVNADFHAMGMGTVDAGINLAAKGAGLVAEGAKRVGKATKEALPKDTELAEMVAAGEDPEDAKAFLAAKRRDEAKARKEKPGYATAALTGIMNGAKRAATRETGTGAYELGMNAVDVSLDALKATGRGVKRTASKGAELLDRGLGAIEQAAVGDGGLVERSVQLTGRAGELAAKAADVALKAGPKILEKGLEGKARAEKFVGDGLAKDWESTKARMAARLEQMKSKPAEKKPWETMEEPAWASELRKGDEDVPDEITQAVAETAAERSAGPENFTEVFDDLKDLAQSDNRSRKAAFLAEAELLEGISAKNADPNEYLGAIGDKFRGWKPQDVKKLLNRLYETNLLAK